MLHTNHPVDAAIHALAIRLALRCRHIIQACLREEEWADADREFYLTIREELEAIGDVHNHREQTQANPHDR